MSAVDVRGQGDALRWDLLLAKAQALKPQEPYPLFFSALFHVYGGQWDAALEPARKAAALDPRSEYTVGLLGEVYAAGPDGNPYRDFGVRSGNYWVNFTQGLKQHYNFDVLKKLGFDNSGTPVAISDDSRTIGVLAGSADSYVITLPEPFSNIAATTNLLSAYTASPAAGSTFAKLTTMKLTFTRTVQTLMQASKIEVHDIVDGGTTVAKAFGFQADAADPYSVNISFRNAEKTIRENFP